MIIIFIIHYKFINTEVVYMITVLNITIHVNLCNIIFDHIQGHQIVYTIGLKGCVVFMIRLNVAFEFCVFPYTLYKQHISKRLAGYIVITLSTEVKPRFTMFIERLPYTLSPSKKFVIYFIILYIESSSFESVNIFGRRQQIISVIKTLILITIYVTASMTKINLVPQNTINTCYWQQRASL